MKEIEYSILLKEEVDAFEINIINLYWEVYYDHHSQRFESYRTIDEILISLNLKENFPLHEIVIEKSSLIIFSPEFSCSLCKKPLCINSRNFYYEINNICKSCDSNKNYLKIDDLIDKIKNYNKKIQKKINVTIDELTYLDKMYILAIYDNISLDDFGKLESNDCKLFWAENYCQNNNYFKSLFDKEILIEIDEDLFNHSRLVNELNSIDFKYIDKNVINYLNYLWSKKSDFGIYLNCPNEFHSHYVWVNTIRSSLEFNNLTNNDAESLFEFFSYIRYRESLIVINSFLSKKDLEIKKDNPFYSTLQIFMKNNSLSDLVFLLEYGLELEVKIFKEENLKMENKFMKFNISAYLLEFKKSRYNHNIEKPSYLNKCYFSEYFENKFTKKNKNLV